MKGILTALAARVLGYSLGLALLVLLAAAGCSSGDAAATEPRQAIEKWARPKPPEPLPVIADAHWSCDYVLSDDAVYRLRQRCLAENGGPWGNEREVRCYSYGAEYPRWLVRASDLPFARTSASGYASLGGAGWMALP